MDGRDSPYRFQLPSHVLYHVITCYCGPSAYPPVLSDEGRAQQAARWRELESRLSDPDSDSETASSTAADAGPRLVVTDELRSAMAAPAPDFLPSRYASEPTQARNSRSPV